MTTDKKDSLKELFVSIANIFAIISVPVGIAVGGLLMGLRSDVDVIKSQLAEQRRTRDKIETFQEQLTVIQIQIERLKTEIVLSKDRDKK